MRRKSRVNCYTHLNWLLSTIIIVLLCVNLYVTLYRSPSKESENKAVVDNVHPYGNIKQQPQERVTKKYKKEKLNIFQCDLPYTCKKHEIALSIVSGNKANSARICVNGKHYIDETNSYRGFNLVVINPATGSVIDYKNFDIYADKSPLFVKYINEVTTGYYIAIATADDASFRISKAVKKTIELLGSVMIHTINFRTNWVFLGRKGAKGATLIEEISHGIRFTPGRVKTIATCVPRDVDSKMKSISFFCENHPEFSTICSKNSIFPSPIKREISPSMVAYKLPIAIIAGNRPFYLLQCIQSLVKIPGINRTLITVFIDGFVRTPAWVANLYGIRVVTYPKSVSTSKKALTFRKADEIAQHYRRSLGTLWDMYSNVSSVIVLEEDLIVSPDFLDYFTQTYFLLKHDSSILTISAWNDNGYKDTSRNASLLYRSEFFSGLGWILTRKLWDELARKWPPCCQGWSWDLWLRLKTQRLGRDTIYPDVSRTYHIGVEGMNMNKNFYKMYFANHNFNKAATVELSNIGSVTKENYDKEIQRILKTAVPIRYDRNSKNRRCSPKIIPDTSGKVYAVYFPQQSPTDYSIGKELCTCFKLWDLGGIRGLYKGIFRFFSKNNHIIAIGNYSKFAEDFMPRIFLKEWKLPPQARQKGV